MAPERRRYRPPRIARRDHACRFPRLAAVGFPDAQRPFQHVGLPGYRLCENGPVGFLAVFVAGGVGTAIALLSAVFRGWADRVLMQITDAFLALPYLMIAVSVISILKPSLMVVILVIGSLRWMDFARVLRGEVLRLAATDFVHLAIVAGCSRWRIIGQHIFPNLINTLLVLATLGVGSAVIAEATLSFLGLGIPRPQPSWGIMLAKSQKYLYAAW